MYVERRVGDWMCRTVWQRSLPSPSLLLDSALALAEELDSGFVCVCECACECEREGSWKGFARVRGAAGAGESVSSTRRWMKESAERDGSVCWEKSWRGALPVEEKRETSGGRTVLANMVVGGGEG